MNMTDRDNHVKILNALRVFLRTPHILQYLAAMDPQAMKQALDAIPWDEKTSEERDWAQNIANEMKPMGPKLLAAAHRILTELDKLPAFRRVCVCGHREYLHDPACSNGYYDSANPANRHACQCKRFQFAGTWPSINTLYGGHGAYCIDSIADSQAEKVEGR